jgi:hypothetical protein
MNETGTPVPCNVCVEKKKHIYGLTEPHYNYSMYCALKAATKIFTSKKNPTKMQ